jgi:hypothetical protein
MYLFALSCPNTVKRKKLKKMIELAEYPIFKVIDNRSPPVSPKVVAQIFITQNNKVNSGILLIVTDLSKSSFNLFA